MYGGVMEKKVLVVLADGFEEIEAISPIDVLKRAGASVTLAALKKEPGLKVRGSHDVWFQCDALLDDVKDDVITLVVDVKGTFMSNDGGRSFSINQKLMMAVHNIYVQKFVPKVAFKKLGVPKRCTTTMKSGKASKVFKGYNFVETTLNGFGL